jgi:membrane fusion protein (multidrug efflux system)
VLIMATQFTRTLRSLDKRGGRSRRLAAILAMLGLWGGYMGFGSVTVYASSPTARLEVSGLSRRVSAPGGGRIVKLDVALGQRVEEGDVLVELDASMEKKQLEESEARIGGATVKRDALRAQIAAARSARESHVRLSTAAIERAKVDLASAEEALVREQKAGAIAQRLAEESLLSAQDRLKAEGALADARAKVATTRSEIARLEASRDFDDRQEGSRIADVGQKLAELEAEHASVLAQIATAKEAIEQKRVRAPATGRLGEVSRLQVGDVLKASDVIATIVPSQEIRVVAELPPADAVGRVVPGQHARVRLDGFAWTQYGMLDATVTSVASEPHDGTIRVELALEGNLGAIPVQHGLPGSVDIEVEHVSPMTLLLRTTGTLVAPRGTTPAPAPAGSPIAVAR